MKITALEAISLGKKNNFIYSSIDTYCSFTNKHINETLDFFPCLEKRIHSCKLLSDNSLWFMYSLEGLLITKDELNQRGLNVNDAKKYFKDFFEIYCIIPHDYRLIGCLVYDSNRYINWEKLPQEHRHINRKSDTFGNLLCTHLYIEAKDMKNPILENLKTAHDLLKAYNHYLITKDWTLNEYKHGKEGEKEYYEKRRLQNGVR